MRTSDAGIEMIKGHEGLVLYAYPDPGTGGEPWTIGYGHTKGVLPGMSISEAQAEAFLREDLEGFERAVEHLLPIPLTQSEFDALVSFAFNVGTYALETSTLRKRLLAGEPCLLGLPEGIPSLEPGRKRRHGGSCQASPTRGRPGMPWLPFGGCGRRSAYPRGSSGGARNLPAGCPILLSA